MSRSASRRRSRMARFIDASQEWQETHSKKAAAEQVKGIREGTAKDWEWAAERQTERIVDERERKKKLMKESGVKFEKQE